MPKLRDKIAVSMIRAINMNPEKRDRVVKKAKLYGALGMLQPYFLRPGFERTVYHTSGISLEIYKRKGTQPKKLILIVHGGVFIIGLLSLWRNLHGPLSDAGHGAAVALVDYRTAPKHTYPAAHNDVCAAWEFLQVLGYAPSDMVLLGDSSGGNLALSLMLRLRDEAKPLPAAAVLISPWTDMTASGASYLTNYNVDAVFGRKKGIPSASTIETLLECSVFSYAGNADRRDPYLSPIYAKFHNLPPVLMTAGSHEMLLDDTLTVAEKLKAADGSVQVIIGEGMFHIYPLLYKMSPTAKETFGKILEFIGEHTVH